MWSEDESDLSETILEEPYNPRDRFLWAAGLGRVEVLHELLQNDINLKSYSDREGYTALHRASSEGQLDVVELLLSHNVDVNACTIDGWTPLHCACKWNQADVVNLLISNGANINSQSNGNVTPLHAAAGEKSTREVLLLLLTQPEIDLNIRNAGGDTAYDLAKRYSSHAPLFTIALPYVNFG